MQRTAEDFQTELKALQAEQAGLNKRTKVGRARSQEITAEFYALRKQWRAEANAGLCAHSVG